MANEMNQEQTGFETEEIGNSNLENQSVSDTEVLQNFYTEEDILKVKAEGEDKYLRLLAEFDNYRKRVSKEKDDLRINTKTQMLSAILDIDSDLALAKKNLQDDAGVNLILNKLESFLKSHGVETIQTDVYDVDLHEVISVLEVGEEKIIDVITKGYTINGKPFRYPKIILGK
jgi:molecular chaperone GrpE